MTKWLISGTILACLAQIWASKILFEGFTSKYCRKLSLYVISRKTYDPNSIKRRKTSFWVWFRPVGPKFQLPKSFLKNLAPPVARYHGQLSSCTISEKTNDSILRKLSDGWTDSQTESDIIRRCPTNVERPMKKSHKNTSSVKTPNAN